MLGKLDGEDSEEERELRIKFRIKDGGDELPFACHICRGPFRDPKSRQCGPAWLRGLCQ